MREETERCGHGEQASFGLGEDAEFAEDYIKQYSDSDRYKRNDIFDEEVVGSAHRILKETEILRVWRVSVPLFALLLTLISVSLFFVDRSAPVYDGSSESALSTVTYILSFFGLSDQYTGNNFTFASIGTPVLALLNELSVSREIRKRVKKYLEIVEYSIAVLKYSKQIYAGSGTLKFSYGEKGIYINGGNVEMTIGWHALFFAERVNKIDKSSPENKTGHSVVESSDSANASTHLLVYLKPGIADVSVDKLDEFVGSRAKDLFEEQMPLMEFFVIPRARFFDAERNCTPWDEFVEGIDKKIMVF